MGREAFGRDERGIRALRKKEDLILQGHWFLSLTHPKKILEFLESSEMVAKYLEKPVRFLLAHS